MSTEDRSLPNTGPTCPNGEMCESATTCLLSTSFAEGSPARTSPVRGGGKASTVRRVDSGPRCCGLFASFSPDTSLWRTLRASASEDSIEYSETWPRAGMTRSGTAYRLRPLVRPISEIGSTYWPTPVADDTGHRKKPYSQGGRALSYMAGGPLSPAWLEWLMGFPIGWTELPPSETP